jgi:peptidoglycan/LPS O-acetylase OafA/YrhL
MENSPKRFQFLDGLRGWAAIVVLLHHIFIDGLPANSVMADRALWAKVFFLNGTLAVCVFFVVSGFSLSIRYLETGDVRGLVRIAAGRYLRLVVPIFAICAITHALLLLGIIPPAALRPSPLDAFVAFTPTISGLLSFSFLNVFVSYSNAETYNPPLWTISYEFLGSFMVLATVAVVRSWRTRTWALGVLFVALAAVQAFFALFIAGVLIADLFRQSKNWKSTDLAGAVLCAAGLVLIVLPPAWFDLVYVAGATCLTAGVAFCAPVRRLFENRLGEFLGWISFPLYLVQAAVIYSFSLGGLDVLASFGFEPSAQRWIVGAATVPVAIVFAIVFCPVNDMAVTISRQFGWAFVTLCDQLRRYFAPDTGGASSLYRGRRAERR